MSGRTAPVAGLTFVVLLLLSASMADVPSASSDVGTVRSFYTGSPGIIVAAQVLSLLAAAAFVLFAWALAHDRPVRAAGGAVGCAAALTSMPVLVLAVVADTASTGAIRLLVRLGDAADVLLFLAIGAFAVALARSATSRVTAWAGAVLAVLVLARAVLLAVGSDALSLVAPLAFVVYVVIVSFAALGRQRARLTPGF